MAINVVHQPNLGTLGAAYKVAAQQIEKQRLTDIAAGRRAASSPMGGGGVIGNPNPLQSSNAFNAGLAAQDRAMQFALNQTLAQQQQADWLQRWGGGGTVQQPQPQQSGMQYVVNETVKNVSPYFSALDSILGNL